MEALASFALACNVMEVLSFTKEIVTISREIRERGSSSRNHGLYERSERIKDVSQRIREQTDPSGGATPFQGPLRDIALKCIETTTLIQKHLAKLQTKDKSLRAAFGKALKSMIYQKELSSLEHKLSQLEGEIDTSILVNVSREQASSIAQQESEFSKLNLGLQKFIQAIAHGQSKLSEISTALAFEANETRNAVHVEAQATRNYIDPSRDSATAESKRSKLLGSLKHPKMNARINEIKETHEYTFTWMYDGFQSFSDSMPHKCSPNSSFMAFLKDEQARLFWVQGKPGSGRSYLMKFLHDDKRTMDVLQSLQYNERPTLLRFFFCLSGEKYQKSSKGFWSSLLYQFLTQNEDSVRQLCDQDLCDHKENLDDWSLRELSETLVSLLEDSTTLTCIFADGLDESDEDDGLHKIACDIKKLSRIPRTKLVFSSRPELELKRSFANIPQVKFQDLTSVDIRKYAKHCLQEVVQSTMSEDLKEDQLENLTKAVTRKAEGVFLWVNYALKSLSRGIGRADHLSDLHHRLELLPPNMHQLYALMWARLNEDRDIYRNEAARFFHFAMEDIFDSRRYQEGHTVFEYMVAANQDLQEKLLYKHDLPPIEVMVEKTQRTELSIEARCAGLFEVFYDERFASKLQEEIPALEAKVLASASQHFLKQVRFIHRTARDFLTNTREGQTIMAFYTASAKEELVRNACVRMTRLILIPPARLSISQMDQELGGIKPFLAVSPELLHKVINLVGVTIDCVLSQNKSLYPDDLWNFSLDRSRSYLDNERVSYSYPVRDFLGLTARRGLLSFIQAYAETAGRELSVRFKNYLLMCSVYYLITWDGDIFQGVVETVQWLIKGGADPYSRVYTSLDLAT